MKKTLPIFIIVILFVGGGAFYGGMRYERSKAPQWARGNMQNLQNLSPEELQNRMQNRGRGGQRGRGDNLVTGKILSADATSVTVKLRDGGSKIIFLSETTTITKSTDGERNDLKEGLTIVANGSANQDGSITAETIQLR